MIVRIKKICISVSISAIMMLPALANAGMVLVSNEKIVAKEISKKDAKALFLGKKKQLEGVKVKVVGLAEGNPDRDAFLNEIIGMSSDKLSTHWIDEGLKGGAKPPKSLKTVDSLIAYVKRKKNAIGYLNEKAAATSGLNVIAIK